MKNENSIEDLLYQFFNDKQKVERIDYDNLTTDEKEFLSLLIKIQNNQTIN